MNDFQNRYHLLLDCGNTRLKWAVLNDTQLAAAPSEQWLANGALAHVDCAQLITELAPFPNITTVLVANVAGQVMREAILAVLAKINPAHPPSIEWFLSSQQRAGIHNGYAAVTQLGCDRFAAAIGAHAMLPEKNLLVVNCGTATTIDAVRLPSQTGSDANFVGGMILPGLRLMARALAHNTAQLPQICDAQHRPPSLADNTQAAILSGCLHAQAGAIEKVWRELALDWQQPVHCVLSGGAALAIAPALGIPHQILDNLVLLGLHAVLRAQFTNHTMLSGSTGSIC